MVAMLLFTLFCINYLIKNDSDFSLIFLIYSQLLFSLFFQLSVSDPRHITINTIITVMIVNQAIISIKKRSMMLNY